MGGKHDRLHATGANLVYGGGIGPVLHTGSESYLASRRLTNSGLNDVAEENLLDFLRRDVVLVECVL